MSKKVLWTGDSTVLGVLQSPPGQTLLTPCSEPAVATEIVNAQKGPGTVESENAGIGGTNIVEWLNGRDSDNGRRIPMPSWDARMSASDADIVVMQVGINDSFLPGFTVDAYGWHVQEIVRIARQYGKVVVVCTPNPITLPHNSTLWAFKQRILALSPQLNLRVVNHYDAVLQTGAVWQNLLPDGVHPSEAYYRFKGATAAMALLALC